jgi:4-amino-4-deoxy-L-arabinose transferase-like glycosyltransferase
MRLSRGTTLLDWHNPWLHSFLTVQIIGFPVAFLVRALARVWRAVKASGGVRTRNLCEAAAYGCFALTSIAFAFNIPLGVALLCAGIVLSFRAFRIGRNSAMA